MQWKKVVEICLPWLFVEIFNSYHEEGNYFQLISVFLNHSANDCVYS